MTTHRIMTDVFRAFEEQGPGRYVDPGDTETITFAAWGQICSVVTEGTETRTLARPTMPGVLSSIVLDTDGGDLTLTVTGGYNSDGDTSITFADAGDMVVFISVKTGTTFQWQAIAQEGTNVAIETASFDAATIAALTLDVTLLTVTGAELNQLDATVLTAGSILADMPVTAGVGIAGTADNFASSVEKVGTLFKTTIVIDIDGLNSGGTNDDVIGADGAGVAHLGQITAARNGTIFAGTLRCIETPTGGDPDIDLWSAVEATGVEDTPIGDLTETKLCNSGDLTNTSTVPLTVYPAADEYLYLACGTFTDATYTAGILIIELWGK